MTVEFRVPVPTEAEALTAIAARSKAHWGYPPEMLQVWRPVLALTPDYLRRQIVRTACRGEHCLGFYAIIPAEGCLDHFWLVPEAIGQGIGRTMFRHATSEARTAGLAALRIVSDPNAEGFHRRMGARRIGAEASALNRVLPVLRVDLAAGEPLS